MSKLKNRLPLVVYLLIVIIVLSFLSLVVGSTKMSASKVLSATLIPGNSNASSIIWQIRMPRLVLAALSGALIAMAGAIMFGIFGTVMIDDLIFKGFYLAAAIIAAVSIFLVTFGVKIGSLYYWLLGSLAGTTWDRVLVVSLFVVIGVVIYVFYYKDLNAMLFGEYTAKTLGVEVAWIRALLFFISLVLSGVAIYACGLLSLTGLIIPYFVRLATGVNYKYLIPVSIMTSASLLIMLDIFSKVVFPAEIPLGIMMVVLCGPFYIYALQRRRLGL